MGIESGSQTYVGSFQDDRALVVGQEDRLQMHSGLTVSEGRYRQDSSRLEGTYRRVGGGRLSTNRIRLMDVIDRKPAVASGQFAPGGRGFDLQARRPRVLQLLRASVLGGVAAIYGRRAKLYKERTFVRPRRLQAA